MSHPMSAVAPQTIVVWPDCQAGTRPGPRRGSRAHPPLFRAAPRNAFVPTGTATYPPSEPLDSVFSLPHSGLDFNGLPNFRRKDPGPGGRIRAGKTRADTPASAGRSETTGPLIFHRCPCLGDMWQPSYVITGNSLLLGRFGIPALLREELRSRDAINFFRYGADG